MTRLHPPGRMHATREQVAILYRAHAAWIHRRCRRILGSDDLALDAVQEVFARAFRHWDSWDGTASRLTWLSRIATNFCLNEVRNARTRGDLLAARREDVAPAPPGSPEGEVDRARAVRAALAGMDEGLARVALLYWLDGMTQAEIAEEVGISLPTVRKRLDLFVRRARVRLGARAAGLDTPAAGPASALGSVLPTLPALLGILP